MQSCGLALFVAVNGNGCHLLALPLLIGFRAANGHDWPGTRDLAIGHIDGDQFGAAKGARRNPSGAAPGPVFPSSPDERYSVAVSAEAGGDQAVCVGTAGDEIVSASAVAATVSGAYFQARVARECS